ncbi:lysophospholipase L1-like esterase [Xanthomonas campestris]|nr:lysophospholipase L1-like esterase [Xanthomonas sp. 3075]
MMAALGTPLRYLALGDSYTIGEGVAPAQRWPMQLVDGLRAHGWNVAPPQIIATTGWTTDELQAGIDAAAPQGPFDLVSLLIGVNNQYRGRSLDEYRTQFDALLQRAIAFADGHAARVLVLSIPDWALTPFAHAQGGDAALIAAQIDAFNSVAAERCAARAVRFVDITATSRDGGDAVDMLVDDGLHPSGAMYARWTAVALPAARDALGAVGTLETRHETL